jgi:hypothetical protein
VCRKGHPISVFFSVLSTPFEKNILDERMMIGPGQIRITEIKLGGRLLPLLAEVWIFSTVLVFIVVRIFGSNTAKQMLNIMGR